MANKITINVNIEENVGHLGEVTVDEADLKAWMTEFEYSELTIEALNAYLSDRDLEMAEKYTDIKDSTWSDLTFEDPTATDIKVAAEDTSAAPEPVPGSEIPRFYWDRPSDGDDPHHPFGDKTARIIDLESGGAIAYVHEDTAPSMVAALTAAAAAKAAL